jgi:hypothetical protein
MKRLIPFFMLMLIWAGCDKECPPISFTSNEEMDRDKFIGTWQYAYSVLYCDQYEPQGSHTYIFDTVYPGDMVSWLLTPVSTQSIIIGDMVTVISNGIPAVHCIEYWEQSQPTISGASDHLFINGDDLYYSLNSYDVLVIDTLTIGPAFEQHFPCGEETYATRDFYVRVQ